VFDDLSTSSLRVAVAGLAARQAAIANNIANIETPGYQARKVEFEEALASAVKRGDMVTLIGDDITVDDFAANAGTIGYEVLTSLGKRYHRVYRVG